MNDLISRSALIAHLSDYALQEAPFKEEESKEGYNAIQNCIKAVEEAPEAERPKGEWELRFGTFFCSRCNNGIKNQPTIMGKPIFSYCPICGAA